MKKPTYKPTRGTPELPPDLSALPRAKKPKAPALTASTASAIRAKANQILGTK